MVTLVTSNKHKFEEIRALFKESGIDLKWQELTYEEIQADDTYAISLDSCRKLVSSVKSPFFMEDTGLYIDALGGFPGPYSSYVSRTIGNSGILRLLNNAERSARFITVVSYYDGSSILQFDGILRGKISYESRGGKGFGFDPIFVPDGSEQTLSEMDIEVKNMLSHRSMAISKLITYLKKNDKLK